MLWHKVQGAGGVVGGGAEFIGSAVKKTNAGTTSFGSSEISGVQSGDLLLLMYSDDFTYVSTTPTGWTSIYNDGGFHGSSTAGLFYKVASSSDTSASLDYGVCVVSIMIALRGVTYDSNSFSSPNTLVCPSITLSSLGAVVICGHGQDNRSLETFTAPSGYETYFVSDSLGGGTNTETASAIGVQFGLSGTQSPGSFGNFTAGNVLRTSSTALLY